MNSLKVRCKITEAQLRADVIVMTKPFGKKVMNLVSEVLPSNYDIESYCNLRCKVVSKSSEVVTLEYRSKGYTSQFQWPISCLSRGFGVQIN